MPQNVAEAVAHLVLDTFNTLPTKCKPRSLDDGSREWTPLSGIVLSHKYDMHAGLQLVSLATGTKSLPVSSLPKCQGLVLHDCHAEVLAMRALNHWFLCEIEQILKGSNSSWLQFQPNSHPPFALHEHVEISLFSTEAPCGDASMELLIAANQAHGQDVKPWVVRSDNADDKLPPSGRGYFSDLGKLRRKPARADAEISMSKSCTDKLMLKQFTSLLSFPADLLMQQSDAAFLKRLIVHPDHYDDTGYRRAFALDERQQRLSLSAQAGAHNFDIIQLPADFRRFEYEQERGVSGLRKRKVSNISCVWVAGSEGRRAVVVEALVNGVKQGFKQFDPREGKGSCVCRRRLVSQVLRLSKVMQSRGIDLKLHNQPLPVSYVNFKSTEARQEKIKVKQRILDSLGGWPLIEQLDSFDICCDD